jgi:pimeloyl-ACP methyl ester carboxylesterase
VKRSRIALGVGLAAGSWFALRELDRRRVRSDPEYGTINAPLDGRRVPVTASDGTELHVEVFGPEGAPTIVLTHGWTEAVRLWTYQIQALSSDYRVVAWDLRGHGQSAPAANGDYSIDAFADDLKSVLDATLPEGERAVLAGHSLGGMTTVAWAGRHTDDVQRSAAAVALVSTGMGDLISEALVIRTPHRFKSTGERLTEAALTAKMPRPREPDPISHRLVRYVALSPAATPAQVDLTERLTLDSRPEAMAASAATLSRLDLYHSLAHVTVPSIVMVGERDKLTPPVHAKRLAEELPEPAELITVPRYGHQLPLEAHDDVTGAIRGLVERYLAAPAAVSSSSSAATESAGSTGNGAPSTSASRSSA